MARPWCRQQTATARNYGNLGRRLRAAPDAEYRKKQLAAASLIQSAQVRRKSQPACDGVLSRALCSSISFTYVWIFVEHYSTSVLRQIN
jgi:hypothetical protein